MHNSIPVCIHIFKLVSLKYLFKLNFPLRYNVHIVDENVHVRPYFRSSEFSSTGTGICEVGLPNIG